MIRAILFTDKRDHRAKKLPGSLWFSDPGQGRTCLLWFFCPCGCGALSKVPVGIGFKPNLHGPSWNWNGSDNASTLTPSVLQSGCGCQGWLRDGYWELSQ